MPLHLLPKKSWNVYAPANIARVRADEAHAQAATAAKAEAVCIADSERRLRHLRGEPSPEPDTAQHQSLEPKYLPLPNEPLGATAAQSQPHRSRKRRHGEDETEHALRLACYELAEKSGSVTKSSRKPNPDPYPSRNDRVQAEAPITDAQGHINLVPARLQHHREREMQPATVPGPVLSSGNSVGDRLGGTTASTVPWYNQPPSASNLAQAPSTSSPLTPTDRVRKRSGPEDPLAAMKRGAKRVKNVRVERERWREQREREVGMARGDEEEEGWRAGRRREERMVGEQEKRKRRRHEGERERMKERFDRGMRPYW